MLLTGKHARRGTKGRRTTRQVAGLVTGLVALPVAGVLWGPDLYSLLADQQALQGWMARLGPWGPLMSVLLNAAQVLLAPVPGQTLGVINGYLYGVGLGTLYSLTGVALGSALAMGLARWAGRPLARRLVGGRRLSCWDRIACRQGPAFFFLLFLLPFVPDDAICFVIGLSPLSIPYMLALAVVGRLPGLAVTSWVGANATRLPWWGWGLLGLAGTALAFACWRYRQRLEMATVAFVGRVASR